MNPIELGKFIASLRNEKNLTQEELAEKLFIDKRKISRWECGTSIPEFEMLIKLSEILDVSLYELSICKRITNEKLTKKAINKFKSLKDFKKYKFKRKLVYILQAIFLILFIITATYTIKYNDTVEIYKLNSMDEKYYLEATFVTANNYSLLYIKQIKNILDDHNYQLISANNCECEIYDSGKRKIYVASDKNQKNSSYTQKSFYEVEEKKKLNSKVNIKIKCFNEKNEIQIHSFDVNFKKIYNNKLF